MPDFTLSRRDLIVGLMIAALLAATFGLIGGRPLIVTFGVGLLVVAALLAWLFGRQVALPDQLAFYPAYFGLLAWQFVHFTEEYLTGFRVLFPQAYGAAPYSAALFVGINMGSYAVFALAFILLYRLRLGFLLTPVLFFVIYGAIGNAIAHSFWAIRFGGYFPGLYTAQFYWLLGPWALARVMGSLRQAMLVTAGFGLLLVPILQLALI